MEIGKKIDKGYKKILNVCVESLIEKIKKQKTIVSTSNYFLCINLGV
jgi:hypothetical protein